MRGSSFTLGIELPHIGNPFFTKIIAGATAALQGTEYQLIIAPADVDGEEGVRAIGALADRQVDGIVAISPLVSPEWLERLAARVPIVMIGRHDRSRLRHRDRRRRREGTRSRHGAPVRPRHRRIVHLTRSEEVTRARLRQPARDPARAVPREHARRRGSPTTSASCAPGSTRSRPASTRSPSSTRRCRPRSSSATTSSRSARSAR